MSRNVQRNAARTTRTLACAALALPALLVAGCSAGSGGGSDDSGSSSSGKSAGASKPAPVKYKKLPDACKTLSSKTIKDLAPKTKSTGGERIGTGNTNDSGSCLWNSLDKYDFRDLTVSLKRFDSDAARGSGNKLAAGYQSQQGDEVTSEKGVKDLKKSSVSGIGDKANSFSYRSEKSGKKKKSEKFTSQRLVARSDNVVVTVDYEGTGFESGKMPKSGDLKKKAQKAAKEAVAALK